MVAREPPSEFIENSVQEMFWVECRSQTWTLGLADALGTHWVPDGAAARYPPIWVSSRTTIGSAQPTVTLEVLLVL
jgi:hypothetical protein